MDEESARRKASAYTQTSMPQVEIQPTIPMFERARTIHALDRAATVIGLTSILYFQWFFQPIQGPGLLISSIIIFHRR
jgi:hypothetical protein